MSIRTRKKKNIRVCTTLLVCLSKMKWKNIWIAQLSCTPSHSFSQATNQGL